MEKQEQENHEQAQVLPSSLSAEAGAIDIDHHAEQKMLRKLDLHILPIVMLLYTFSFLDRQAYHFISKNKI